jgi:predicted Rossmann-fold nucleotide-binding protein
MNTLRIRCFAASISVMLFAGWSVSIAQPPEVKDFGKSRVKDATPSEVRKYFQQQDMQVVTFCGYSGAGYEHPKDVLKHASKILANYDPAKTIVNCGATSAGIGEIYKVAKDRGFPTTGIVSSLADEHSEQISSSVDAVFFVKDESWGGTMKSTGRLSPTSQAMVECSDVVVAIGGGEVTRDELLAAKKLGIPYRFIPADMNHRRAIERAKSKKQPIPTGFRGAAHAMFGK